MDENQKFKEIIDTGLEEYFKRNPRIAVEFGKEEYEKEVESGTAECIAENINWFSQWIDQLKQLDIEKLNFENKISLKTMEYYHNINLFMYEDYPLWKKEPNGLAYFQETIFLLFQRKGPSSALAEVILAHAANLPKYLKEFQSRFDNTPIPIVWRDLALSQVKSMPKFLQMLTNAFNKTSDITESIKIELFKAFKDVESVGDAHTEWIKDLPVDQNEFAWALGPDKFDKLLSLQKLPWDRKTLLKKGNQLFNSIYKELKHVAKELDPSKPLNEVIKDFFKKDQVPSFQEVLNYTQNEAKRAKEFIKSHNLATIPQENLVIVETPPYLTQTIPNAAYYQAPYFNKDQPGIYIISPAEHEERHQGYSYTAISNTMVHEAYPGHHLDFVCNNEYTPFVRLLGTALETVEGWAHYCEEMMLQQGFHKDSKKAKALIIGAQLFRAIRLLLDIQLHCKERSIEDAIKMLMNILQMGETEAKIDVLRYTSNPGYNISYLLGKILIEELRREVEEKMGSKFSLKFFHDTILRCGDLPYHLLKQYFDEKIKNL